jgi:hypothetical protein
MNVPALSRLGVSGDLLPINTPAQAELGRGTLGVGTMLRAGLFVRCRLRFAISRLGYLGNCPTQVSVQTGGREQPGAPSLTSLTSYPCRRIANSVKSSKPRSPLVKARRSPRQAVISSAG